MMLVRIHSLFLIDQKCYVLLKHIRYSYLHGQLPRVKRPTARSTNILGGTNDFLGGGATIIGKTHILLRGSKGDFEKN